MVRIGHLSVSEPVCAYKAAIEATVLTPSWFCRRPRHSYAVRLWIRIKDEATFIDIFETLQCSSLYDANCLLDEIENGLHKPRVNCVCGGPNNMPCGGTCDGPCGGPCDTNSREKKNIYCSSEDASDDEDSENDSDDGASDEEDGASDEEDGASVVSREAPKTSIASGEPIKCTFSLPPQQSVDHVDQKACCFSAM